MGTEFADDLSNNGDSVYQSIDDDAILSKGGDEDVNKNEQEISNYAVAPSFHSTQCLWKRLLGTRRNCLTA